MATLSRISGIWANAILRCALLDNSSTTGGALTSLTPASTGLRVSTIGDNEASGTSYTGAAIQTIATPGTYVAPAAASCRFGGVDQTNHPGLYEIQLLNTRLTPTNSSYLVVTIQAPGSNCSPQSFVLDLSPQVDVRNNNGVPIQAVLGVQAVNAIQIAGDAGRVTKWALEMDGRTTGTVTSATFNPTVTQFECVDITDADLTPVYAMRAVLVTSGAGLLKRVATVLTDVVGTSGRRFTVTAMPAVLPNGATVIIM